MLTYEHLEPQRTKATAGTITDVRQTMTLVDVPPSLVTNTPVDAKVFP